MRTDIHPLWLPLPLAEDIVRHALESAPDEACGIVGGRDGNAERVIRAPNAAPDPRHSYHVDDAALARAIRTLHAESLEIVAFYHSHPRGDFTPSSVDIDTATYRDTPYLIVGLAASQPALAAWYLRDDAVYRVPLHIGSDRPPAGESPLSPAQKAAIIVTAALALAFMLALSLSLLPPAPEIPIR